MLALGKWLELSLAGKEPSAKLQLTAQGSRLRWLDEGILEITPCPSNDIGLDLVLSAGVHGNETAPIELLDQLLRAIARSELVPAVRVLFVLGNPAAVRRGQRCIERDLNRLFNGAHLHAEGPEALRAGDLEHYVSNFFAQGGARSRIHLDLHTTLRPSQIEHFALYPFDPRRPQTREAISRLARSGMQAVVLQQKITHTFSAYSCNQHGAEAFTLELGPSREFGANPAGQLRRVHDYLWALIAGCEETVPVRSEPTLYSVSCEIMRNHETFELHLPEQWTNFAELNVGHLLAEDGHDGRWIVHEAGARLLFANARVAIGHRAALILVPATEQSLQ